MKALIDITPYYEPLKIAGVVLGFILGDILTGLFKAFATHSYSSSVMREGLFHKLGELLCIAFGALCDFGFPALGIAFPFSLCRGVCVYVIIMETGSIIENVGMVNPDLAKYLHRVFDKIEKPEEMKEEKEIPTNETE